jgi:very-short-patch-repair endonuclease
MATRTFGVDRERERALRALAAKQHSAFSRSQALALGFSPTVIRTRIRNGDWLHLRKGVYAIAGSGDTWERRAMATQLHAGDGAALSCFAAASLLELIDGRPERIDVAVPTRRKGGHTAKSLGRKDIRHVGPFVVTCPARTLIDLAGVARPDRLEDALDRALFKGLATPSSVRDYIEEKGLGRRKGVGLLQRLLDDRERDGAPEVELERRFERLVRKAGLPMPTRQHWLGRRRIDYVYADKKIAIELDGRGPRASKKVFERDRKRQNAIVLDDWKILRFTWDNVTLEQDYVIETLRSALAL